MFSPYIPLWIIIIWLLLCLAGAIRGYVNQRRSINPRQRRILLALRIAALILFALLVARPYIISRDLNPDAYRVTILADKSLSMTQLPMHAESPQIVRQQILEETMKQFTSSSNCNSYCFASHEAGLVSWGASSAPLQGTGSTAIGTALQNALSQSSTTPLGAIVLLTDGRENTVHGLNAMQSAKLCARQKIPVSVICYGDTVPLPHITASFTNHTVKYGPDDQNPQLSVNLANTSSNVTSTTLHLKKIMSGGRAQTFSQQTLQIAPQSLHTIDFPITDTDIPGVYAIYVNDASTADDYAQILLETPPPKKILYLGNNSSWQFRFIRQALGTLTNLRLSAMLRLPIDANAQRQLSANQQPSRLIWCYNLPQELTNCQDFPASIDEMRHFDGAIIECGSLINCTEKQSAAIRALAEKIGGGLLFTGNPTLMPPSLRALLPGKDFTFKRDSHPIHFLCNQEFIFETPPDGETALPANIPIYICSTPSRTSRWGLTTTRNEAFLLASGYHGDAGGRVAWLGCENLWSIALSGNNAQLHHYLWQAIAAWLTSERQKPLSITESPITATAGEAATICLQVLDQSFTPSSQAQCTAIISIAGAEPQTIEFAPVPKDDGNYKMTFTPPCPGLCNINIMAKLGNQTLMMQHSLLVRPNLRELTQNTAAPELLADIARVTGGKIFQHDDRDILGKLPVSDAIPRIERKIYPMEKTPLPLIALTILLIAEWRLRRRLGLK